MTWFRVDDRFHDHKKARRVRRSAPNKGRDVAPLGLWVLAGSWSGLHHTGGFVPTEVLLEWDDDAEALAGRLVAAKLWTTDEVDGEEGYRFHDWREKNPGEDEDYATYSARGNHIRWHVKRKKPDPECEFCKSDSSALIGGESGANRGGDSGANPHTNPPVPSRPDPTRPDPTTAAATAAAANATPPPQDLIEALDVAGLTVRWDTLTEEQILEVRDLHAKHGTHKLVQVAQKNHRRDNPALYASAWIKPWRAIRVIPDQRRGSAKCIQHRQQMPCSGCAADAKTGATA